MNPITWAGRTIVARCGRSRGVAVPETALVLSLTLSLLIGPMEMGIAANTQIGLDEAAFFGARAVSSNPTYDPMQQSPNPNDPAQQNYAQGVAKSFLAGLAHGTITQTARTLNSDPNALVQSVTASTTIAQWLPPGLFGPGAGITLSGTHEDRAPQKPAGTSVPFSATATLTNYCASDVAGAPPGGYACDSSHQIHIGTAIQPWPSNCGSDPTSAACQCQGVDKMVDPQNNSPSCYSFIPRFDEIACHQYVFDQVIYDNYLKTFNDNNWAFFPPEGPGADPSLYDPGNQSAWAYEVSEWDHATADPGDTGPHECP
jgi:hypothetical protein